MPKTCECCGGSYEYKVGSFTDIKGRTADGRKIPKWFHLCRQHAKERVRTDRGAVLSILSPDWGPGGAGPLFAL